MTKILAIDARLYKNGSGAGKICTATIDNFVSKYYKNYKKIVLYTNNIKNYEYITEYENIEKKLIKLPFIIYKFFILPFYLKKDNVDILFSPTTDLPFFKIGKVKYINMVHDLFMEEIIDTYHWKKRGFIHGIKYFLKTKDVFSTFYALDLFKKCSKIADKIVSISNFTKKQVINQYNINGSKIENIYIAPDDKYFEYSEKTNLLKNISKFNIGKKYIFTYDVIGGYEDFSDTINKFITENNLIWVILNKHDVTYEIFKKSKAYGNAIFIREFVSDIELASLIYNCEFIFFPSPGEGFGLPIVESMVLGKKILATNITAIPEIGNKYITTYIYENNDDLLKKLDFTNKLNINKSEILDFCKANYNWNIYSEKLNKLFTQN